MKPITIWRRMNDKKVFEFNHIEDGHVSSSLPTPKHESHQKTWARGVWKFEHAHLNDDTPPVILKNAYK